MAIISTRFKPDKDPRPIYFILSTFFFPSILPLSILYSFDCTGSYTLPTNSARTGQIDGDGTADDWSLVSFEFFLLKLCPLESTRTRPSVSGSFGDLWLLLDTAGCVASSEHCDQQYCIVLYQTYCFWYCLLFVWQSQWNFNIFLWLIHWLIEFIH